MDSEHLPAGPQARHSPFWSCLVVFSALFIANFYQTIGFFQTRSELQKARASASQLLPNVRVLRGQLEPRLHDFTLDLLQLANTNDAARQLITQFQIRWNPQAQSNAPAASPKSK